MKKINADFNGDITGLRTSIKVIGNIGKEADSPLCLVSEKNLVNILKAMKTISAEELAQNMASKISLESRKSNFNVKTLQNILNENLEQIQFMVDCGDLLVGDDSKIKEFLNEEVKEAKYQD